jgi:hypothetical protein
MEVLARIQPFFGTSIEDVLQTERTHLPAGSTVVMITSYMSDAMLDNLARLRQSGHSICILFVGDTPPLLKLSHVTLYHIGGEETWKEFMNAYSATSAAREVDVQANRVQNATPGLHL